MRNAELAQQKLISTTRQLQVDLIAYFDAIGKPDVGRSASLPWDELIQILEQPEPEGRLFPDGAKAGLPDE